MPSTLVEGSQPRLLLQSLRREESDALHVWRRQRKLNLAKIKQKIPKSNFSALGLDGRLFPDHLVYGWR